MKQIVDEEKEKVRELSEKLENPENHPWKMELKGEDPDEEPLRAKI